MGTSSSRNGRVTNNNESAHNIECTWKSAKNSATRFFNGTGSFGVAFQKVIKASGGPESFAAEKRIKKSKALGIVFGFLETVNAVGLRQALTQSGIIVDGEKSNAELITEYINYIVYPDAVSYSDTTNREEIIHFVTECVSIFDEQKMEDEQEHAKIDIFEKFIWDDIASQILNSFEEDVPQAIETNNSDLACKQREKAKKEIFKKVKKCAKNFKLSSMSNSDAISYMDQLYQAVINEYYKGEENE